MPYEKVQFIAHCIYTAFNHRWDKGKEVWKYEYNGLPDQEEDLTAKIQVVEKAIKLASEQLQASTEQEKVLKIFMLPEMFFQARSGAYEPKNGDLIIEKLQNLVKGSEWKDWLFVFGTIVQLIEKTTPENCNSIREVSNFTLVQKGGWEGSVQPYQRIIKKIKSSSEFIKYEELTEKLKAENPTVVSGRYIFEATKNEQAVIELLTNLLQEEDADVFKKTNLSSDEWRILNWTDLKQTIQNVLESRGALSFIRLVRNARSVKSMQWGRDWIPVTKKLMKEHILNKRKKEQNESAKKSADGTPFNALTRGNTDVDDRLFTQDILQELLNAKKEEDFLKLFPKFNSEKFPDLISAALKFSDFDLLRIKLQRLIGDSGTIKSIQDYQMPHSVETKPFSEMRWDEDWIPVTKALLKSYSPSTTVSQFIDFSLSQDYPISEFVFGLPKDNEDRVLKNIDFDNLSQNKNIVVGLEICADHGEALLCKSLKALKKERIVDIQLIPSAGSAIASNAIASRANGYIFNCDGWNIGSGMKTRDSQCINEISFEDSPGDKKLTFKPHSDVLQNLSSKVIGLEIQERDLQKVEIGTKVPKKPLDIKEIVLQSGKMSITEIFPKGAGELHIYPPQTLNITSQFSISNSTFPHLESSFALSLSDEPILLNGMKVIFDQPVPVYPVNLQSKE